MNNTKFLILMITPWVGMFIAIILVTSGIMDKDLLWVPGIAIGASYVVHLLTECIQTFRQLPPDYIKRPMSKLEYYLSCLGEECGEVSQAIGKTFRFGLFDRNPNKPDSDVNIIQICKEIADVVAVFELLVDEHNDKVLHEEGELSPNFISREISEADKKRKKDRVFKYMGYSRALGRVE